MADIANSMNASTPTQSGSGQIIPADPESVLLSPEVREAMDLIFPRSATQLLQRGLSLEADSLHGVRIGQEHPSTTAAPVSHVTLPMSVSAAPITATTTNIGMVASSEIMTFPSLPDAFVSNWSKSFIHPSNSNVKEIESSSIPTELPEKTVEKIRISKADFEITSSFNTLGDESHKTTYRKVNSMDLSSSECHSKDDSDSEDMRRPFAREKKKKKKKKSKSDPGNTERSSCEINVKSSKEVNASSLCPSNNNSVGVVSQKDFVNNTTNFTHFYRQESYDNFINKNTWNLNSHGVDNSQNCILENGSLTREGFNKHSDVISKEASDDSFSPIGKNVQNERSKKKQKLPEIKRLYFNIVKHKNKIRNTFPPCFVVAKKISTRSYYNLAIDFHMIDMVIPLPVRLKHLSKLCERGSVNCKEKKATVEYVYRNIFEETVLPGLSEDEFENSRGRRSLRKRDKHISYVEPSEDDILDEYSRKRSRSKHKEPTGRSEDEGSGENKKRNKQKWTDTKTVTSDSVTPANIVTPQDNNDHFKVTQKDIQISDANKTKIIQDKAKINAKESIKIAPKRPKEIIVYPPTSSNVKNSYCLRVDGSNNHISSAAEKSNHVSYSKEKDTNSTLVHHHPTNISVLPSCTLPGAFTRHPNPVMLFPSLPLGFPRGLPSQPLVAGAPITTLASMAGETQKPPQYCVVKMDGKDVLLQLIPSNGVNVPVPVVMPKGKTLFVPPVPFVPGSSHLFGQPLRQTLSVPNSTPAEPTSIVTAPQGNTVSRPLQSLFGIPVISTSSPNISVSALNMIPAAQLGGITSTSSVRPLNLTTSRTYNTVSSSAGLSAPVNAMSSMYSGVSSAVTSITSSTLSTQAVPTAVAPMAAPNTTTVVRSIRVPGTSLRAVVPNSSTSVRSVRIFVPGCSANGTPGRFATLGSIASSSPLTHMTASSALLPQRKNSLDQELTPERQAAKRRKLEKKYPLPPGVVIKTEPLDTISKPSSVITTVSGSRSLLSQNVHMLSTARPGTSFQSIRIISPSLASALSARNIRGNSNIIYRATSLGGGQTVLFPTSFGHISTVATTSIPATSLATSSSFDTSSAASPELITVTAGVTTTTTTAVTTTKTKCTSDSTVTTTVLLPSSRTSSEDNLPFSVLTPVSELTVTDDTSIGMSTTDVSSTLTSLVTSCESTNGTVTSLTSLNSTYGLSLNSSVPEIPPAKAPFEALTLENVRVGIEDLRKMIHIQEVRGLKGERLEKLKELLQRKEEQYEEMLKLASMDAPLFATTKVNGDITGSALVNDMEENTVILDEHRGSETDPFVID